MNIRDIRADLVNYLSYSDEFLREQVTQLVGRIDEVIKEENQNISYGRASEVLESYKNQHEMLSREFFHIPTDKKHTLERLYKAQEVLVTIDTVMYYIEWALSRCTGANIDSKIPIALRADETYFKEASFRWCQILSSMNAELKLKTTLIQSKTGNKNGEE